MVYHKNTASFGKMLFKFMCEPDPMLAMLEWMCYQMMQTEVSEKLSAKKGEQSDKRTDHRCGSKVRRLDSRMGTIYSLMPKVRKGCYTPFFVTKRKRTENALIQ